MSESLNLQIKVLKMKKDLGTYVEAMRMVDLAVVSHFDRLASESANGRSWRLSVCVENKKKKKRRRTRCYDREKQFAFKPRNNSTILLQFSLPNRNQILSPS